MAVTVLETLSREDLDRWRAVCSNLELVQSYHHDLPSEEARQVWRDYWECTEDLLARYGIEGEEAVEAKITPHTGHIYTGAEE